MPDRLLGRGKFGEVYVGDWMGTPVAVKRVYDFDVKENIDLFQAEIKVWSVRLFPNSLTLKSHLSFTMSPRS
jgi:hypothetical protein